jgi:hypothetical protein
MGISEREHHIKVLEKLLKEIKGKIELYSENKIDSTEEKDIAETLGYAISSLKTDEAYQLEYESTTTNNDLTVDCVSRIEVIDYLCKHCPDDGECFKDCDEIKHLRQMPSVTPIRPKGHWIETHGRYKCSVCYGTHIDSGTREWHEEFDYKYPFCPNCGAKMESEVEK